MYKRIISLLIALCMCTTVFAQESVNNTETVITEMTEGIEEIISEEIIENQNEETEESNADEVLIDSDETEEIIDSHTENVEENKDDEETELKESVSVQSNLSSPQIS